MPGVPERVTADLVLFVFPGLLHGLGNALFVIDGHARLLDMGQRDAASEPGGLLRASQRAGHLLELARYLVRDPAAAPAQAGVLLKRLCECLRVPLRERGLRARCEHTSTAVPTLVDGAALCQTAVAAIKHLVEALPSGFLGTLRADVAGQDGNAVLITLRLENAPATLRFPLDLEPVVAGATPVLESHGARLDVVAEPVELRLRLPAGERYSAL